MALTFLDGIEIADKNVMATQGWQFGGTTTITTTNAHKDSASNGGTYCMEVGTSDAAFTPSLATNGQEICFYVYFSARSATTTAFQVWFQKNGLTNSSVYFRDDGYVEIRWGTGTVRATSAITFAHGAGYWIRIQNGATASSTCTVEMNGQVMVTYTGDLMYWGPPGWNRIAFQCNGSSGNYVDDIFIFDNTGNMPFGQECYVLAIAATGDDTVGLTRSTGAANYETIDEIPPSDADYNEGTTTLLEDIYTHGGIGYTPNSIYALAVYVYGQRDGVITQLQPLLVSNVTKDYGTAFAPGGSGTSGLGYQVWTQDPDTATTWTVSGANATKFGARIV